MSAKGYVHWFSDIRLADVPVVGGKNASLGELYSTLSKQGVHVPNGFALTACDFNRALPPTCNRLLLGIARTVTIVSVRQSV